MVGPGTQRVHISTETGYDPVLDKEAVAPTAEGLRRGAEGRRLRILRNDLELSHAEFAERYSFDLDELMQWEEGRVLPPEEAIDRFREIQNNPQVRFEPSAFKI